MISVYTRAQQGDLSLLNEIDGLSYKETERCFTLAAQFGQIQLLEQWIGQRNTKDFAAHGLWVAAHDGQLASVEILASLVSSDDPVWESVLRYAIKNNWDSLQETILAFDPKVGVDSCLLVTAQQSNKPLMKTLLNRSKHISAHIVISMMKQGWNDLVTQWVSHLPSDEKNKFFVHCVTQNLNEQKDFFEVCKNDLNVPSPNALAAAVGQKNWILAEQLLSYCDVAAAVKIVNKQNPTIEMREQLQRLVLLNEIGNPDAALSAKRKI